MRCVRNKHGHDHLVDLERDYHPLTGCLICLNRKKHLLWYWIGKKLPIQKEVIHMIADFLDQPIRLNPFHWAFENLNDPKIVVSIEYHSDAISALERAFKTTSALFLCKKNKIIGNVYVHTSFGRYYQTEIIFMQDDSNRIPYEMCQCHKRLKADSKKLFEDDYVTIVTRPLGSEQPSHFIFH